MSTRTARCSLIATTVATLCLSVAAQDECLREAETSVSAGNYWEALKTLDGCDTSVVRTAMKGLIYYRLYLPDSAQPYLRAAYEAGQRDDELLISLSEAALWKADRQTASSLLAQVGDKNAKAYKFVRASLAEMEHAFDTALTLYDQIIATDPNNHGAYAVFLKAQLLSWMSRFDESIALYAAFVNSPKLPAKIRADAMTKRAEVMSWMNRFKQALSEADAVLKLSPKHIEARRVKATVYEWKGNVPRAKQMYQEILKLAPDDKEAMNRLASIDAQK
jgi:tetratricopeptide (TPR) repeat protein